jgi:hypothetical protein
MNGPATTTVGQPQDRRERSGWVNDAGSRGGGLAPSAQRSGAVQSQRGHGCTLGVSVIAGVHPSFAPPAPLCLTALREEGVSSEA